MSTMVVSEEKKLLRQTLLTRLLSLTKQEIERRSKNVERIISNLSIYKKAKRIMVYYPLSGEVDLLGMIRKVLKDKEICFPVIDLARKKIVPYVAGNLNDDFIQGPYGVRQPDTAKTKQAELEGIDLVFVPGLAFDRQKNRLGRGGGFYDRFLNRLYNRGRALTVGVAFDFQIYKDLPVSIPQDAKVNFIVTDADYF
ncbi:MAG: 5-formyltetrahydrofolate cyclo-ligase [Candidatus Omnitrophota bacterium]